MKKNLTQTLKICAAVLLLISWTENIQAAIHAGNNSCSETNLKNEALEPQRIAKHAILIALDGWGAYSVPKAQIPHIKSLMKQGCYTLHKRSVLPSSSAINWASMFNGAGTEMHGYTEWGSRYTRNSFNGSQRTRNLSHYFFSIPRANAKSRNSLSIRMGRYQISH